MSSAYKKRNPPRFSEVLGFLRSHFGKTPWMIFGSFAGMAVAATANSIGPLVWGWFVNTASEVSATRHFEDIFWPIAALTGLSIIGAYCDAHGASAQYLYRHARPCRDCGGLGEIRSQL